MQSLSRRSFLSGSVVALGAIAAPALAAASGPAMIVYHDPGCNCCVQWAGAMLTAGFRVTIREQADMQALKRRLKVPEALSSCHTTTVAGLVVEGHVPADAIRRLIRSRPKAVIGIAAPGMPRGSPGMETPDGSRDPLNLTLFDAAGRTRRIG